MVKGISRQVIVMHSPDPKLFEQAIFILREEAVCGGGITDDALMQEAKRIIRGPLPHKKRRISAYGAVWACGGAMLTGLAWLLTAVL